MALAAKKGDPGFLIKNQPAIFESAHRKCNVQTKTFQNRSFCTNFREEEFKPPVAARFTLKQP